MFLALGIQAISDAAKITTRANDGLIEFGHEASNTVQLQHTMTSLPRMRSDSEEAGSTPMQWITSHNSV